MGAEQPYLHRAHHSNHPNLRGKNFEGKCDEATEFGVGKQDTPLNPVLANLAPLRAWYERAA